MWENLNARLNRGRLLALLLAVLLCGSVWASAEEPLPEEAVRLQAVATELPAPETGPIEPPVSEEEALGSEEEELSAPEEPAASEEVAEPREAAALAGTYVSYNEAVEQLRAGLVARQGSVTVYMELFYAPTGSFNSNLLEKAMEHTGNPKEGDYIHHNMNGCRYSCDYYVENGSYYVTYTATPNWLSTAAQEAEVDAAVEDVLEELDLYGLSEYEKIVAVYDYITENVQYDFDNYDDEGYLLKHSTYAAIIQKEAVCQGYATLLYRLLLEVGVDCRYISGISENEGHAWNIVQLDGKYYNVDATWDRDLKGHYRYFLCNESNFGDHRRDSKYNTAAFHAAYPMADTSYIVGAVASGVLSNGMTWVLDDEACLTVTGTGAIPAFRNWDPPWEPYQDSVRSIVLSEGITEVGDRAFAWCKNATSVTLPDSLTVIREYGFNNLRSLKYIDLPPNLRVLEHCAFSECAGLQEIILPDSVTTVESSCFSNNPGLKRAVLSAGMTHVPNSMFFNDTALREVVLPDSITSIGDTAFNSCGGLRTFTIPAHLTSLGSSVFAGCSSLTHFYVAEGNPTYRDFDGVLCSADGRTLISCPAGRNGTYTVPEGITTIARSAFGRSYYLDKVILPNSLTRIEAYAFSWCEDLDSITIGRNVQFVGDSAFRGCRTMTSVTFLSNDTVLDKAVFADCDYLVSVDLPDNLKEIPYGLFYDCANIMSIDFPPGVTRIGDSAFLDCDWLSRVTVPGTVKTVGRQAFDYCNLLSVLVFEPGVQRIEEIAIRNMPTLWRVEIPPSVTYIGRDNFENCPKATIYGYTGSYAHQYATANGIPFVSTHTHRYSASETVWPTCTEQGYTIYRCSCGDSYYGSYTAARGHTIVTELAVPATCTTSGRTEGSYCGVCGEVLVSWQMTQALGHDYGAWYVDTAPTCISDGRQRRDCTRCEDYLTEVLPTTGEHSYDAVVTAPICTEQGYTTYTCPACGDSYVDSYVDALGHKFSDWIEIAVPTCDGEGRDQRKCGDCGEIQRRDTRVSGDPNRILVSNPMDEDAFSGKKVLLIGDSITAGVGTTKTYGACLAELLGVTVTNKGVSGSGYCSGGAMATNKTLTEANVKNADVITILLGVNDWNWAVKNGSWNGKPGYYDEAETYYQLGDFQSMDPSTFYGALHQWCRNIVELKQLAGFEEKQFVVMTPLVTSWNISLGKKDWDQDKQNIHGHTLRQYCAAIMEVCAYYDIPVFDANLFSGIYYRSPEDHNVTETGGDGVHINAAGHALLAEALAEFLLEGYAYEERTVTDCGHSYETIVTEPTCVEGGSVVCRCPNCHYSYVKDQFAAIGHNYTSVVTAPTCTEQGYTTYTCACGDSYVGDYVAALGHDEVIDPAVEPTCTETGLSEGKHCVRCGEVLVARTELPAAGHRYEGVVTDPTCTEQGYTTYTCPACGDSYVDSSVPAVGHSWDKGVVTLEPTEEAEGIRLYTCTACGETKTETIPRLDHVHKYTSVVTAPTCTEQGYTTYTCACGDSYVGDYVAALGHDEVIDPAVEPTCTETGLSEGKHCARCDEVLVAQTELPAAGHRYEGAVTDPTCTEQGYTTYTCSACGDSYVSDSVPAVGHSWDKGVVTLDPTEEAEGIRLYTCTACGETKTETIPRLDHVHKYTSEVTVPTCTEQGYTAYICACGDSYVGDYVAALGHDEVIDSAVEPTCTETGLSEGKHCERCGEVLVARTELPAAGHRYEGAVTDPTCTEQGYTTYTCPACGDSYVSDSVPAVGHSWDKGVVTLEPTEEAEGIRLYTCTACGETKTETIPRLDHVHKYTSVVTAPTCTEQGYTTYTCACGDSYVGDYVAALGHDEVIDPAVPPTCTESGLSEGKHCVRCGEVLVARIELPAAGHCYEGVATDPTCTEQGYTTYICPACGDSYVSDSVPAVGHSWMAGICTVCGHDSVEVDAADGSLRICSDGLEEGSSLHLAAYGEGGRFLSLTELIWQGGELEQRLPEGESWKLLFLKDWRPLRQEIPIQ